MTENQWWFVLFLVFALAVGLHALAWIMAIAFVYWLISTGFKSE